MRTVLDALEGEFQRYKLRAEDAIRQLSEDEVSQQMPGGMNSIATLVWHVSGNFESRFTEFLHSDGEKPWRGREEEFHARITTEEALLAKWERGWSVLFAALGDLTDADLSRPLLIRGVGLTVCEALARALAHVTYHVGQIVYIARSLRGDEWTFLSIPPGQSEAYNRKPTREKAPPLTPRSIGS